MTRHEREQSPESEGSEPIVVQMCRMFWALLVGAIAVIGAEIFEVCYVSIAGAGWNMAVGMLDRAVCIDLHW